VHLGSLDPSDVLVELVVGRRGADGALQDLERVALVPREAHEGGNRRFEGVWGVAGPGCYGYGIRVRLRLGDEGPPSFHDPVIWA
jgi:hypothetical protein